MVGMTTNGLLFAGNNTAEIILRIDALSNSKRLPHLIDIINNTSGVVSAEYCYSLNCVMLTVNPTVFRDKSVFLNQLKNENFQFVDCSDLTIAKIKQACKDPMDDGQ